MPLVFINISEVFSKFIYVNNSICPSTKQSRRFNAGYHSMCYFWFIDFFIYLKDYQWLLRIDTDCELVKDSRELIPPKPPIYFSSSYWMNLEEEKYDTVSATKPDGDVVRGMKSMVKEIAVRHQLLSDNNNTINTWKAPYSNVMYLNLTWARDNHILTDIIHTVDSSQCIYSNRWGDSPLWGAAIRLLNQPYYLLPIAYFHGSHHVLIDNKGDIVQLPRRKRGWFQFDFLYQLLFYLYS